MQNKKLTAIKISILVFLIIVILLYLYLPEGNSQKTYTISGQQFYEDYEEIEDESVPKLTINYKSYNEGDKLIIQDKIDDISYFGFKDITNVEFNLDSGAILIFQINGDITEDFDINQTVEISFTIQKKSFTHQDVKYDIEVWKEAWDKDYFLNNSYSQILPQSAISSAK